MDDYVVVGKCGVCELTKECIQDSAMLLYCLPCIEKNGLEWCENCKTYKAPDEMAEDIETHGDICGYCYDDLEKG